MEDIQIPVRKSVQPKFRSLVNRIHELRQSPRTNLVGNKLYDALRIDLSRLLKQYDTRLEQIIVKYDSCLQGRVKNEGY